MTLSYPVDTFKVNMLMQRMGVHCEGQYSDVIAVAAIAIAWNTLKLEGRTDKSALDAIMDMAKFCQKTLQVGGEIAGKINDSH